MFHIIPWLNSTTLGQPFAVNYSTTKNYKDCALIGENILVVGGTNNTLSLFAITQTMELKSLSKISLGTKGSIEDLVQIEGTNEFLIADGINGLLKASFSITRDTNTNSTSFPGFTPITILVVTIITVMVRFRANR
jgi:hypothetical protein